MKVKKKIKMSQLREIFKNKSNNVSLKVNSLDGYQSISRLIESGIKECLLINGHLEVSIDQQIEVEDKGWVRADRLKMGDRVLTKKGLSSVNSIENIGKREVFTITVDYPKHRYFCNDVSIKNCSDAMNTYGIFKHFAAKGIDENMFLNSPIPLTIDHKSVDVLRNMCRGGMPVDLDYFMWAAKDIEYRLMILEEEIYKYIGRKIDVGSPDQVSDLLFDQYNIPVLAGEEKNKKGRYSTKQEVLDKLFEKYPDYPILRYVVMYRKLADILTKTYLKVILNFYIDAFLPWTRVQAQYSQSVIPTGRFSSSANSGKSRVMVNITKTGNLTYRYYQGSGDADLNLQGIPSKLHMILKKARRIKKIPPEAGVDPDNPYPLEVMRNLIKKITAL